MDGQDEEELWLDQRFCCMRNGLAVQMTAWHNDVISHHAQEQSPNKPVTLLVSDALIPIDLEARVTRLDDLAGLI